MSRSSLFWGVILVVVGLGLLVGNLLQISVWEFIWPLALIFAGAWILFGRRLRQGEMENIVVPMEGAAAGKVRIDHGAGTLTIRGGCGPDNLAEGSFGGGVSFKRARVGDAAEVEFRFPQDHISWIPGDARDWNVHLTEVVPLAVTINAGAGKIDADFSGLNLTNLNVSTGASAVDIILPSAIGVTRAKIEGGATAVNVRVPEGTAARIHSDSGLSSLSVDTQRFPQQGNLYVSPDFDITLSRVELEISVGVGSVTIR